MGWVRGYLPASASGVHMACLCVYVCVFVLFVFFVLFFFVGCSRVWLRPIIKLETRLTLTSA